MRLAAGRSLGRELSCLRLRRTGESCGKAAEPTGNLDSVTAAETFGLLERLNAEGKTVLYVTHDRELAQRTHRVVTIRDGLVVDA